MIVTPLNFFELDNLWNITTSNCNHSSLERRMCQMQLFDAKKIQLRLSDLLILFSYPVIKVLTQTTLLGDIMDYGLLALIMAFFGMFIVVCGLFWLIIFFCFLGPLLTWCGWARIDDVVDLEIPADLRALVRRKSYITRHPKIRKRRRRNQLMWITNLIQGNMYKIQFRQQLLVYHVKWSIEIKFHWNN